MSLLARYAGRLRADACMEWPNARSADGYGQVSRDGRTLYVHRVAFAEANGREPVGEVRHTCDNPPCFNPAHLIDGTHRQNAHDMLRRMRQPAAKLDWQKVADIRSAYGAGGVTQQDLAGRYGVSQRLISQVTLGKAWPQEAVA
ncbi:MAG: HNH endonuclease [Actinomycetota bacterium]|nr:HNH endonuclease [Actinomycetota bacterium]